MIKFCPRCLNTQKKTCVVCSYRSTDRKREEYKFKLELYQKARRFNMEGFGSFEIDESVLTCLGFFTKKESKQILNDMAEAKRTNDKLTQDRILTMILSKFKAGR